MATQHLIKIPQQADQILVDAFILVAQKLGIPQITVNAGAAGRYEVKTDEELPSDLVTLLDYDASLLEAISADVPGFGFKLHKGGLPIQGHPKSAIYDDIQINYDANNCKLTDKQRVEAIGIISNKLGSFNPLRHVKGGVSDEQNQVLAIHNAALERLEKLNEELIKGSEQFRKSIEKDYRQRTKDLETTFDERSQQLNAEIDQKRNTVIEREEKLITKLKEIDDRQNTHVRREIRQQILEEIRNRTEEFKLTKGTNKLRLPIHIVCLVLISILGLTAFYYAIESIKELSKDPMINIAVAVLVGKQLLVSGGFGASVIFYIRWMNAWFSQHASTEFQLRQFQLDIERASWVVETALEWKDAKGSTIPAELLDPIANNLFGSNEINSSESTPADDLASALLGTASKVRLNVAGSELELDGRKLNQTKRGS